MPMTPRCQPAPDDDQQIVAADVRVAVHDVPGLGDDRGFFRLPPRVLLAQLPAPASCAPSRVASSRPRISSRSSAASADPIRPAAFSRGAMMKLTWKLSSALRGQAALLQQRVEPGARSGPSTARPGRCCAITRFSPTSGTTSASVPMAATFRKCGSASAPRPAGGHQRLHELQRDAGARQAPSRDTRSRPAWDSAPPAPAAGRPRVRGGR